MPQVGARVVLTLHFYFGMLSLPGIFLKLLLDVRDKEKETFL